MLNRTFMFDMDGVFIDEDNNIAPGVLEFLRSNKIEPIVNTGRLVHDIEFLNDKYGFRPAYMIGLNGAHIKCLDGSDLLKVKIDSVVASGILEILEFDNKNFRVELNSFTNRYFYHPRPDDIPKELFDSAIVCDIKEVIDNVDVACFLLLFDNEDLVSDYIKLIRLKYGDMVQVEKTSSTSAEIFSKQVSKGNALEFLKDFSDLGEIISYGDSDNDISMLEGSDISFAIKGKKHVEVVANHVIDRIEDSFVILEK